MEYVDTCMYGFWGEGHTWPYRGHPFADAVHAEGIKAHLWWAPLAADPGSTAERERPDPLLRNADGSGQMITWWNSHCLCPAYEPVRAQARAFVRKAIGEWGFDALKIDGQHLNAAPNVALVFRAGWDLRTGEEPRWTYGLAFGFSFGMARPR